MAEPYRTELTLEPSLWQMKHSDHSLLMGSCFSNQIGNALKERKFRAEINPLGTMFSPLAIHKSINSSLTPGQKLEQRFTNHEGVWYHYDYHSDLRASSKGELQGLIEDKNQPLREGLSTLNYLVLTWGTAWVYEWEQDQNPVANCHKTPSGAFRKKLLTPKDITRDFDKTLETLLALNPSLRIIITVSPVRHTKDTLPLNAVSKSTLRLAAHHLQESYDCVEYFPSYEIVMDDLRDYRFYAPDFIHPNEVAVQHIWKVFSERYFSGETKDWNKKIEGILRDLRHKPFNPQSDSHRNFIQKLIVKMNQMNEYVDFSKELKETQERFGS